MTCRFCGRADEKHWGTCSLFRHTPKELKPVYVNENRFIIFTPRNPCHMQAVTKMLPDKYRMSENDFGSCEECGCNLEAEDINGMCAECLWRTQSGEE